MKVAMVIPSRESEKAISSYSMIITESIKKQKVNIENVFYKAGSPSSFFRIIPKLKKYDIIHLHHEYNLIGWYGLPFFLIYIFLGIFKKNILVTMMHTVISQKQEFKENPIKSFLRKRLYFLQNKIINWSSDSIIVCMQFHKDILVKEYSVNPRKIEIFPSGGPTEFIITPKSKAKKELGLSGPVYLVIGNLTPDSGLHTILKYADKIGKTILVVSSPIPVNDRKKSRLKNYLDSNIKYVKNKNYSKYVRFDIKPISDQMPIWWKYFSAADIVLQAYKKGIASGIFLHAMAMKTPVVANDTEFFGDIEKEFGCLKTVKKEKDYSKVIKEVMNPRVYKKIKKGCEKYVQENNWDKLGKRYKTLYESLINKN